jgi:hypothetical protein
MVEINYCNLSRDYLTLIKHNLALQIVPQEGTKVFAIQFI